MTKEELIEFLENDLKEWEEHLESIDKNLPEFRNQIGEIQYIEGLIFRVKHTGVLK